MTWYVGITALNGRNDYARLASMLYNLGIDDAWYYSGIDLEHKGARSSAHLRFTHEADAVAFALRYGGNVSSKIPGNHVVFQNDH